MRRDVHFEVGRDAVAAPLVCAGGERLIGGFDLREVLVGEGVVCGVVGPELVNALRVDCRGSQNNGRTDDVFS